MAITAQDVKKLRELTGAGMMDAKKALVETEGDFDKAVELLQIKGLGKAEKKADRVAAEGLVDAAISSDKKSGAIVEVNSETDFVARNEEFIAFVRQLAQQAIDANAADADALLASTIDGETVDAMRQKRIATIGENITVRRVERIDLSGNGIVGDYTHNGNISALVAIDAQADVAANEAVAELARDIAMHVAAMNPQFAKAEDIDPEVVEAQTRIETEKAIESGRPANIAEKMVTGRIAKWKQEICLTSQPFVKNGDLTVAQEIERVANETGIKLSLNKFIRVVRGEGIEKAETMSYAEEVAAALKG